MNALIRRDVKIPKGSGGWNQQSVGLAVVLYNGPEARKRPESGANRNRLRSRKAERVKRTAGWEAK